MDLLQAHATIGVTAETPLSQVQERYRFRARMLHPDRAGDAEDLRAEANRAMSELNEAWSVIQAADRDGSRGVSAAEPSYSDQESAHRGPLEGECDWCGAYPARRILLRSTTGLLLVRRDSTAWPDLCQRCGVNMFRITQARTMITGWWGPVAALVNIRYISGNWLNSAEHRKSVPPPQGRDAHVVTPTRPPVPIAKPVMRRVGPVLVTAWFIATVLMLLGALVASAISENSDPGPTSRPVPATVDLIGTCVTSLPAPVDCSSPEAAYRIVSEAPSAKGCSVLGVVRTTDGRFLCASPIHR